MTWVVADYVGSPGSRELTVHKGQQVEILDLTGSGSPEMCLVRLLISGSDVQPDGRLPLTVLKQLPHSKLKGSGDAGENGKFSSIFLLAFLPPVVS